MNSFSIQARDCRVRFVSVPLRKERLLAASSGPVRLYLGLWKPNERKSRRLAHVSCRSKSLKTSQISLLSGEAVLEFGTDGTTLAESLDEARLCPAFKCPDKLVVRDELLLLFSSVVPRLVELVAWIFEAIDWGTAVIRFAETLEKVCVDTVESGHMTKDLALLIGPDQCWLTTNQFFSKIAENLETAMS